MQKEILDYLTNQAVGVLSVAKPDGSIHGATLHVAYKEEPLSFYFGTHAESMKGQAIRAQDGVEAALVIGFSEEEMKTFQAEGIVRVVPGEESDAFDEVYLGRFPNKKDRSQTEGFLRVIFTPKWWRYSDMKNHLKISSEDN